jgi:hypothetical protein
MVQKMFWRKLYAKNMGKKFKIQNTPIFRVFAYNFIPESLLEPIFGYMFTELHRLEKRRNPPYNRVVLY